MCFQRKRQLATQMFFNRMFDIPCGKLHRVSLNRVSQFGGLVGSSWHHHLPPHLLLESASNKHITWTSYALFGPHVNPGLCNKYDCAHNLCAWAIYWLASTVMKAVARLTPLQHVELNSSAHFCKSKPVRTEWTRLPLKVKIYSALRCSNQTQPSLGALSISRQFAGQFLCIIARVYFDRIPHMVCQTSRRKTFRVASCLFLWKHVEAAGATLSFIRNLAFWFGLHVSVWTHRTCSPLLLLWTMQAGASTRAVALCQEPTVVFFFSLKSSPTLKCLQQ